MKYITIIILISLISRCGAEEIPEIQTVLIKGETYTMGNHLPKRNRQHHEDEPKITVTTHDFKIGTTRVTATQFCKFLNSVRKQYTNDISLLYYTGKIGKYNYTTITHRHANGTYAPKKGKETSPANQVTWQGAMEFCKWLSQKTGKTYRLPAEAEWELAARRKAEDLNMCQGQDVVGEWCINRWNANPKAEDMTNAAPHLDDLSSERSIRGQRKWQKSPLIPFPFSNNSMYGPSPWTRQHQEPHDIKSAAWYGFRVVEEIQEKKTQQKN